MQVEWSGDFRDKSDGGLYSLAGVDPAEVQYLDFYGAPETEQNNLWKFSFFYLHLPQTCCSVLLGHLSSGHDHKVYVAMLRPFGFGS